MKISNFGAIYNYFSCRNYDNALNGTTYLVVSIIGRCKDYNSLFKKDKYENAEAMMVYKTILIYNLKDILKYQEYIETLCDKLNARAYITTSPRLVSSLNATLLSKISSCINSEIDLSDSKCIEYQNMFDSACKQADVIPNEYYHTYLIDIDRDISHSELNKIKDYLHDGAITTYKTIAGWHILCRIYDAKIMKSFFETEFNNIGGNMFITQKGKGCRALLCADV